MPLSTSDVVEGSRLYHTPNRVIDTVLGMTTSVCLTTGNQTIGGEKSFTHDMTSYGHMNLLGKEYRLNGVRLKTSDIPENGNLYWTDARFDTRFETKTTTNLTEGTNLYYTDARVQSVIDADTGLVRTTGTQNIAGYKSFSNDITLDGTTPNIYIRPSGFGNNAHFRIHHYGPDIYHDYATDPDSGNIYYRKNGLTTTHTFSSNGDFNIIGEFKRNGNVLDTDMIPTTGTNEYITTDTQTITGEKTFSDGCRFPSLIVENSDAPLGEPIMMLNHPIADCLLLIKSGYDVVNDKGEAYVRFENSSSLYDGWNVGMNDTSLFEIGYQNYQTGPTWSNSLFKMDTIGNTVIEGTLQVLGDVVGVKHIDVTPSNSSGTTDNSILTSLAGGTHNFDIYWSDKGRYGQANGATLAPGTYSHNSLIMEIFNNESAGIFLNENNAGVWSPSDVNIAWFFIDEDTMSNGHNSYISYVDATTGMLVASSDRRFKENIKTLEIENVSEEFKKLNPVSYTRKANLEANKDKENFNKEVIGFIAQEVNDTVFKNVVKQPTEDSYMGIEYSKMVVYQTMVIQDLIKRIEVLEARVAN